MPETSSNSHNLAQEFEFVFLQLIHEIDFPYVLLEQLQGIHIV